MASTKPSKIALVWSQFTDCHIDRCIALAERLEGRVKVVAIEVATTSSDYADFGPSSATGSADKRTLFPGQSFEAVPRWRRSLAVLRNVWTCRTVCIGVPYSELDFLALAWVLRLLGKRVVLMCDSKFDDFPRFASFELCKRLGLSCFDTVMVGGSRGADYFRFLGFRRRTVLLGVDTISLARVRAQAAEQDRSNSVPFDARDFVFVGRFVEKKNLSLLIDAYAEYCRLEDGTKRRLVLVGSGPLESRLRAEAEAKVPAGRVVFVGFMAGAALYNQMRSSLGLMLVSTSEQWGLVVNEALALGLPVIVTQAPGSRDVLVRHLVNGFVLENGAIEGLARAMQELGASEALWNQMAAASLTRAPLGDVAVFIDAIERLLEPERENASAFEQANSEAIGEFRGPMPFVGRDSLWESLAEAPRFPARTGH